jgi:adenine-specific DNA-methyltransferase
LKGGCCWRAGRQLARTAGWKGGGSFVYFELKKYNQEYIDRIMEATSLKELEDTYVEMRNNAFLKFWFDRSQFEKDEELQAVRP